MEGEKGEKRETKLGVVPRYDHGPTTTTTTEAETEAHARTGNGNGKRASDSRLLFLETDRQGCWEGGREGFQLTAHIQPSFEYNNIARGFLASVRRRIQERRRRRRRIVGGGRRGRGWN